MTNTVTEELVGEKRVYFTSGLSGSSSGEPEQECEGRNLEAIVEVEAMEEVLLLACPPLLVSFAFLYSS